MQGGHPVQVHALALMTGARVLEVGDARATSEAELTGGLSGGRRVRPAPGRTSTGTMAR